jgi:hypothetical protein
MSNSRYDGSVQHAAMSPSSAEQWMNCPASITRAAGRTRPSSRYAREGTAAHRIAEMIINGDLFPPDKITVEGETFVVGLPMLRALNPYIDLVQRLQSATRDIHIEARVGMGNGTMVWGTADCAAKIGPFLHIVDLKFGMGVPVSPDTAQLKIYALSAIHTFWPFDHFRDVHLTVVQPRLNPVPQVHNMGAWELASWNDQFLIPAVRRVLDDDGTERVGPYCRWCVRRDECDAFARRKSTQAADIFDDGG